jgi:hypothetical protein
LLCAFSLSLSLSVSDFIVADPFLARNLERCTPADWRHTTAAEDSLIDHFSEDEARTKQNQKKAAKNYLSLSLPLKWEYDHQSAQRQAQIKHNGKRAISSSRSTL